MENNLLEIKKVVQYIEENILKEKLTLENISQTIGYSKYHLHRMFTSIIGMTINQYVLKRTMTLASDMLINSDKTILDIAIITQYECQRTFTKEFKKLYHCSPNFYRKHKKYYPLQEPFQFENHKEVKQIRFQDIKTVSQEEILLLGYQVSTKKGFYAIGKSWRALHKNKNAISNRKDYSFLIGVNDYTNYTYEDDQPAFTYFAGAEVDRIGSIPKDMELLTLPKSTYIVFVFQGKNEDSMQPYIEYIYQDWFLKSSYHFNEHNQYDFVKYGEIVNEKGISEIQIWIPVE